MRITVVVPPSLKDACNHTHMLLEKAKNPNTYTKENYEDTQGNTFCVSSGLWTEEQFLGLSDPNIIPSMVEQERVPEGCDLELVALAQANFILQDLSDENYSFQPTKVQAFLGDSPLEVLNTIGLTAIPEEIQ